MNPSPNVSHPPRHATFIPEVCEGLRLQNLWIRDRLYCDPWLLYKLVLVYGCSFVFTLLMFVCEIHMMS